MLDTYIFVRQKHYTNLMEYVQDENIWTPSYFIQVWPPPYIKLAPCVTLNLPQKKLFKPNYAEVQ